MAWSEKPRSATLPECGRRTGRPLKCTRTLGCCQVRTLSPKGLPSRLNASLWPGQERAQGHLPYLKAMPGAGIFLVFGVPRTPLEAWNSTSAHIRRSPLERKPVWQWASQ